MVIKIILKFVPIYCKLYVPKKFNSSLETNKVLAKLCTGLQYYNIIYEFPKKKHSIL